MDARRRANVLAGHFRASPRPLGFQLEPCLHQLSLHSKSPEPSTDPSGFGLDISLMHQLLDGHDREVREHIFNIMAESELFHHRRVGGRIFLGADYNQPMEVQRELTLKRILYLRDRGVFKGWLSPWNNSPELALRVAAIFETIGMFDHSLAIKLGVNFHFWGGAIKYLGTQRHHEKWLRVTEDCDVFGCFAMTELGHGSNVRGIETVARYDPCTQEFVINTPCQTAQKYWIGGATLHATHAIVFAQLHINGRDEGIHAFIAQIRDKGGELCTGVRIADCGHKTGLNGVDNGRIWFDNVRVPRVNLLNSVADVTPDGQYISSISNADQRFAAFMSPLTYGRVTIILSAVYQAKIGLATAIRYSLTRRAFSLSPGEPEVVLMDYPSHQRRLIPLLAKTYAMSFAAWDVKRFYVNRTPADGKAIHALTSGYKAMFSWHNMRTLQECREACGGQGLKSENRIGQLKVEHDVQLTFEGDNNVLMQQVSKTILADFLACQRKGQPVKGFGLEHLNEPAPTLDPTSLRDGTYQLNLFRIRERDLLHKLALATSQQGIPMHQAMLKNYQLAEEFGRAFSERSVLDSFLAVEKSATGTLKFILALLRSLYVAVLIDEDPVFLRHAYMTPEQAIAVRDDVAKLCDELRPHVLTLVDAFGIPEPLLGPIAFDWVLANTCD